MTRHRASTIRSCRTKANPVLTHIREHSTTREHYKTFYMGLCFGWGASEYDASDLMHAQQVLARYLIFTKKQEAILAA